MLSKFLKLLALFSVLFLISCAGADRDRDGIPDKIDECPTAAEDFDKFEDNDGCPDKDNDKDGVTDAKDKCLFVPEDRDGFEDTDGCPDKDNDKDGIPDTKDKCPDQAEDKDNFQDTDGCPDLDNDKDGVLDVKDECPLAAEDKDGFEDKNGCPDFDNDGDGIKDGFDKCPNEAEVFNGKDDDDGCPDADADPLPLKTELLLRFTTGAAQLTFEDKTMLDNKIVPGLLAWKKHQVYVFVYVLRVDMEIDVYLNLLNDRTKAVYNYLISKGIERSQIKIRTITEELYESKKDQESDFNSDRPVLFKRVEKKAK